MKAYLLYQEQDFNFGADLPPNHEDLIQDLELATLLEAMALGDKFLHEVSARVVLASLGDPEAILHRQRVLADCIAEPEIIREMYAIAVCAVRQLEAAVIRLKQLRKIADDHAERFRSPGFTTLFRTLQRELDDEYFQTISYHLKQLRFRNGELISAELDRDNSGLGFVLRSSGSVKRSWKERLGMGPRSS